MRTCPSCGEANAIAELETWKNAHKARSCQIEIDDGYGATCWRVELHGEGKRTVLAAECNFFVCEPQRDVVYLMRDGDDWPGLGAVILAAIDCWKA